VAKLAIGDLFPSAALNDIDGVAVQFPAVIYPCPGDGALFLSRPLVTLAPGPGDGLSSTSGSATSKEKFKSSVSASIRLRKARNYWNA
jgi:hypothetical protein